MPHPTQKKNKQKKTKTKQTTTTTKKQTKKQKNRAPTCFMGLKLAGLKSSVGWMGGYFVYRRSTLKGHIASNKFYVI